MTNNIQLRAAVGSYILLVLLVITVFGISTTATTIGVIKNAMAQLKVAIIGGGPAGLAAAIEMSKRSYIDWKLYEKKDEISEIGNGLTIQRNTWRMLERLGAAHHLHTSDFFRPLDGHLVQHR